jgi:hypothetical protein
VLNDIQIKSFWKRPLELTSNFYNKSVDLVIKESNAKSIAKGLIKTRYASGFWLLGFPAYVLFNFFQENKGLMASGDNTIYILGGLSTRKALFRERHYGEPFYVEELIVHEAAHTAWDKLGGEKYFEDRIKLTSFLNLDSLMKRALFWEEGFCSYVQKNLMKDCYNHNAFVEGFQLPSDYEAARSRIYDLVFLKGSDFFKRIPTCWASFPTKILD